MARDEARRRSAFARQRSALRDVVKEGLLKACRVSVSIPWRIGISIIVEAMERKCNSVNVPLG